MTRESGPSGTGSGSSIPGTIGRSSAHGCDHPPLASPTWANNRPSETTNTRLDQRVADRGPRERRGPVGRRTGRVELAPEPHRAPACGTPVPEPSARVDHEQVMVVMPDRGVGRVPSEEPGTDLDRATDRLPVRPGRKPQENGRSPCSTADRLRSSGAERHHTVTESVVAHQRSERERRPAIPECPPHRAATADPNRTEGLSSAISGGLRKERSVGSPPDIGWPSQSTISGLRLIG